MNDDLNLILMVVTPENNMSYIALQIPHGMNKPFWKNNYLDFSEPHVLKAYKKLLPPHCQDFVVEILDIQEAFEIVKG